jgi:hypothetical protein
MKKQKGPAHLRRASFLFAVLWHDFFSRELAVHHALNTRHAVVVSDVDGTDALRVATQGPDVADPQVDRDAFAGHNQETVLGLTILAR